MASSPRRAVVTGREIGSLRPVSIEIEDGRISAVNPANEDDALPWIGPGLVDLQVNGFAGSDLNSPQPNPETVNDLTRKLHRLGVTSYLPTVVTAAPEDIEARIAAIAAADRASIAGIHLEGPFISPEDGPRGAHPRDHVCEPDWKLFQRWQEAADGLIRIITLSPEWPDGCDFIARCRASGVKVAIGHTGATPAQIREAVAAGATMSTHLGNGAHTVLPRHPNYIWEQLAADGLWATTIGDGFHLPDAVLKVIFAVKQDRAVLVSDVVALGGMPPGEYESGIGERVVLTPGGRLHLAADPRLLAGSAKTLIDGIAHLVKSGLVSLAQSWEMASTRPARFLGLKQQSGLAVGSPADVALFDLNGERGSALSILRVLRDGQEVYANPKMKSRGEIV